MRYFYTQYYYNNAVSVDSNVTSRMMAFREILRGSKIDCNGEKKALLDLAPKGYLDEMAKMAAAVPTVVGDAMASVGEFKTSTDSLEDSYIAKIGGYLEIRLPRNFSEYYLGQLVFAVVYFHRFEFGGEIESEYDDEQKWVDSFSREFVASIRNYSFNDGRDFVLGKIVELSDPRF